MIRTLLAIIALFASVALAQRHQHCMGKAFTTSSILIDAGKRFDDVSHIFFDSKTGLTRVDAFVLEPRHFEVQIFDDFNTHVRHQYFPREHKCVSEYLPRDIHIQEFCLARNATKEGQVVIGGTMHADVWKEVAGQFEIRLVLNPLPHHDVPVNILSRGGSGHNHQFSEFWDWKSYETLPDQSVFKLPQICTTHGARNSILTPEEKAAVARATAMIDFVHKRQQ